MRYTIKYLLELKWGHAKCAPFKNNSKGSNGSCGEGVPINYQHVVAHASVKGHFCNNVHACIPKLQANHGYVRLGLLKEISQAPFSFHVFLL